MKEEDKIDTDEIDKAEYNYEDIIDEKEGRLPK